MNVPAEAPNPDVPCAMNCNTRWFNVRGQQQKAWENVRQAFFCQETGCLANDGEERGPIIITDNSWNSLQSHIDQVEQSDQLPLLHCRRI